MLLQHLQYHEADNRLSNEDISCKSKHRKHLLWEIDSSSLQIVNFFYKEMFIHLSHNYSILPIYILYISWRKQEPLNFPIIYI